MATDNIALVRRLLEEVWNKGNLDVLGELVADDYVSHEPIVGEVRGVTGFAQQVKMFRAAFPDLVLTIDDIGLSDDRVFIRWTARGTHSGSFLGFAPTNRAGELVGISIDRLARGKIVEHHQSYDSLRLLQIIGAVPALDVLAKGGAKPAQPQAAPRRT